MGKRCFRRYINRVREWEVNESVSFAASVLPPQGREQQCYVFYKHSLDTYCGIFSGCGTERSRE